MGKNALSPSSLALRNRGGRRTAAAALGRRPEGSRAAGVMGKREVGPWGLIPLSNFTEGRLQEGAWRLWSWRRTAVMGGTDRGGSG
jgi:hypothetical protein